jgi:predicted phage terminase large subunit-like protein
MLIEANQSQRWLQQELQNKGLNAVPIQTTRNKEEKLVDLSIPLSNGIVKFVKWDNPPFDDLISQMLSWPDARHDDLMDSLSMIVEHTDLNPSGIISGSYRDA